jgi:type II secretory pathway component PulC
VAIAQEGLVEPAGVAKALRLFAVYPSRDPRLGRAALGAAEASSRTYLTGALLENGAELSEVFDDRVVLVRERRAYTLYLPHYGESDSLEEASDLTVGDFAPPEPELQASTARTSDALRVAPAYSGDVIVGFSAYPGVRRDQFESLGLQSGDVLVRASGYALNDVAQMEAVLERLAAGEVLAADLLTPTGERRKVTLDGSIFLTAAAPSSPLPISIQ